MTSAYETDFVRAAQFIAEGKFSEAHSLLESLQRVDDLTLKEQLNYQLLKIKLLNKTGKYEQGLQLAENTLEESLNHGEKLQAIDAIISILEASWHLGQHDRTISLVEQGENILSTLPQDDSLDFIQRKATLTSQEGNIYVLKGDLDQAQELLEQSLALFRKTGEKENIAFCLNSLGRVYWQKGEWTLALNRLDQALPLLKELGNKKDIATTINSFAVIYMFRGELDKALEFHHENLTLFEELDDKKGRATSLANIAWINCQKGDLDLGIEGLKKSLIIFQELGNNFYASQILFYGVPYALQNGETDLAQIWLDLLEQMSNQEENKLIKQRYLVNKALVLKTADHSKNKDQVERILQQVIEDEIFSSDLTALAMLHLCDLYLSELEISKSDKLLKKVYPLVERFQTTAKKYHSHWLLCESYVLQSKLALMELDIKTARRLLTQAQLIAEERDLKNLAIKISLEHDSLLEQLDKWQELKKRDAPLVERLRLARVREFLGQLTRRRIREIPRFAREEPIMLLLLHETGVCLYSKKFTSTEEVEDQLFAGFLAAIQAFSNEVFAQEIDRVKLKKYTLLIEAANQFQLCYVFKGATHTAQKTFSQFIQAVKNTPKIWESLVKTHEMSMALEGEEHTTFENLLNSIFLPKK